MKNIKSNKGVTLIVLAITIIILLILASISLIGGTDLLLNSRMESIMTNMITIKAKAKMYEEEVNAQVWDLNDSDKVTKREEIFGSSYQLTKSSDELSEDCLKQLFWEDGATKLEGEIKDLVECYNVDADTINKMGIEDINVENEKYLIVFKKSDYSDIDIIYKNGIVYGDDNQTYYSLSKLQEDVEE